MSYFQREAPLATSSESLELRAEALLRDAQCLSVPVDLNKVAEHLKVKVHYQRLEDRVSGVLLVKGGERHVLLNESHPVMRQRYSLAHEIGHLTLHHNAGDRLFVDAELRIYQRAGEPESSTYLEPESATSPEEEREANAFAAALLMPFHLVTDAARELKLWDELDVAVLANAFNVSEQAMLIRLQRLELVRDA